MIVVLRTSMSNGTTAMFELPTTTPMSFGVSTCTSELSRVVEPREAVTPIPSVAVIRARRITFSALASLSPRKMPLSAESWTSSIVAPGVPITLMPRLPSPATRSVLACESDSAPRPVRRNPITPVGDAPPPSLASRLDPEEPPLSWAPRWVLELTSNVNPDTVVLVPFTASTGSNIAGVLSKRTVCPVPSPTSSSGSVPP
jgi:hypothetical protein